MTKLELGYAAKSATNLARILQVTDPNGNMVVVTESAGEPSA